MGEEKVCGEMTYEEKKIVEKLRAIRELYIALLKKKGADLKGYTPPLYIGVHANGFISAFSLKESHEDKPNEYYTNIVLETGDEGNDEN